MKGGTVLALLLNVLLESSVAFAPPGGVKLPVESSSQRSVSLLFSSSSSNKAYSAGDELTNDFRQFLNQCSIQSFLIVTSSLRDVQTTRWVNNFTAPVFFDGSEKRNVRLTGTTKATNALTSSVVKNNPNGESLRILKYHGLGVMNTTLFPTWESYFSTLLEQPDETFLVTSYNGLSKDYEVDINTASLCTRIISVRGQIAQEFANDLGVLATMGQHTMDCYWDYMDNLDNNDDDDDDDDKPTVMEVGVGGTTYQDGGDGMMPAAADGGFGDTTPRKLPPHNLAFLTYALDPIDGFAPSALRRGNFDLLVLLATQESIFRILNNKQQEDLGSSQSMYQKYLLDFYAARSVSHFSGIQRYNRADDFLEELLFSSPASGLADPVRLTEILLKERRHVALEWQAMSQDVPNDHICIKRLQLDKLMQSYG